MFGWANIQLILFFYIILVIFILFFQMFLKQR